VLLLELPPFFLWMVILIEFSKPFTDNVGQRHMVGNHAVNRSPVGNTTNISIVDEHVNFELSGEVVVVFSCFFWIVAVDGIEFHTTFSTPVHGIVK